VIGVARINKCRPSKQTGAETISIFLIVGKLLMLRCNF
jgi:hypothetical protein